MTDFDVILGMDWLAENHATIDCRTKEVIFSLLSGPSFKFKGTCTKTTPKVVSMMKAERLVQQGGWAILACVVDVTGKEKTLDIVLVVNKFFDVFSEDLPEIPTSRVADFAIELEPRIGLFPKHPIACR